VKTLATLVVAALTACNAFALPPKSSLRGNLPGLTASASIMLNSFDYKEDFPPPGKSSESGWLFGIALRYTYKGGTELPLYGRLHFDFSPSGTEYGSNEELGLGIMRDYTETSSNWFSRLEFDGGYTFHRIFGSSLNMTTYTGYGYRFWRREISNHGNLLGYAEDYSWGYIPVGVVAELPVTGNWSVGLEMALRIMVTGSIYIALEQFRNPTLTLGNRLGWFASVPMEYTSDSGWGAGFTAWYEYSAIGQSEQSPTIVVGQQQGAIYEPPSRTHQFGFLFTGTYRFSL
jgi:hypothetical protein